MKKDRLDGERCLVEMHLLGKPSSRARAAQAIRLAELAKGYLSEGYAQDAVDAMSRSLKIVHNPDGRRWLERHLPLVAGAPPECPHGCGQTYENPSPGPCPGPECNRLVVICSDCHAANRWGDPFCRACGQSNPGGRPAPPRFEGFTECWHHPCAFESLSPSPVVVGDVIAVPMVAEGNLLGLKLADGREAWKRTDLTIADRHTGLTAYYPYLYVHSTNFIQRFMPGLKEPEVETIYREPQPQESFPAIPYVNQAGHRILFSVHSGVVVHDVWRGKAELHKPTGDCPDRLFPIPTAAGEFTLSCRGAVASLSCGPPPRQLVGAAEAVGVPVSSADGRWVFFESAIDGKRKINAWAPATDTLLTQVCSDNTAPAEDLYLYPPLAYKDGVIFFSHQGPLVYWARVGDGDVQVKEIRITVSLSARQVQIVEAQLSTLSEGHLFSRVPDGFFYVQLDKPDVGRMVLPLIVIESRPIISGRRAILLCKDGVRCFVG